MKEGAFATFAPNSKLESIKIYHKEKRTGSLSKKEIRDLLAKESAKIRIQTRAALAKKYKINPAEFKEILNYNKK